MRIIPAIDLKDGKCVRLRQGDFAQETVYSDDPAAIAKKWQEAGAGSLHVVDLNGAFEGEPKNLALIEAIAQAVSIPIQVGGGIRSLDTVRTYFGAGAKRVVMGTTVLSNRTLLEEACEMFPGRVLVGIDAKNGLAAIMGWTAVSDTTASALAKTLYGLAIGAIIYTDINKDGMLGGPNLVSLKNIVAASPFPVIASGGITKLADIEAIKALGPKIEGVIVGKALYEGMLDLPAALAAAN